jgi:hypothetical protein
MNNCETETETETETEIQIKKSTFWICRPHEGPEQYEFVLESVIFSDGISRFIYKSEVVPEDYFPRMVYIMNTATEEYEYAGSYSKNEKGKYIYKMVQTSQQSSRGNDN